ncbi:MAG: Unknown protein, partial [uncultured Sulfurovum sp.]
LKSKLHNLKTQYNFLLKYIFYQNLFRYNQIR